MRGDSKQQNKKVPISTCQIKYKNWQALVADMSESSQSSNYELGFFPPDSMNQKCVHVFLAICKNEKVCAMSVNHLLYKVDHNLYAKFRGGGGHSGHQNKEKSFYKHISKATTL